MLLFANIYMLMMAEKESMASWFLLFIISWHCYIFFISEVT